MPINDMLAPPALEFRRQDIALGDAEARVLAIVDYPPRVGPAWLARLGDLPGVSGCIPQMWRPSQEQC